MIRFKTDSRALERQLRQLGARAPQVALGIVNRLSWMGASYARDAAQSDSGELKGSIFPKPNVPVAVLEGGVAQGGWHTASDHGPYVEFGTGHPGAAGEVANGHLRDPQANAFTYRVTPTLVRPKTYTKKNGKVVNVKGYEIDGWVYYDPVRQRFVHTVGQPAQPYMYPALLHTAKQAGKIAADVVRDALEGR